MKIPRFFKLFNHTIVVNEDENLHKDRDYWGLCQYRKGQILLDKNISKALKEQTFCHELTHMILDHMRSELSEDENFVHTFSELIYQALETMEY